MKIAVAGHTCIDIIPEWQKGGIEAIIPGHILEMEGIQLSTGGSVPNTGLALQKLGMETSLFGKIGDDPLGRIISDILQQEKADLTQNLIVSGGETSSYTIVLSPPDTDRVFLHSPGTNNTFTAADLPYSALEEFGLFHFGYPPLMRSCFTAEGEELVQIFKSVREKGLITSLDMAMPDPDSPAGQADWKKILANTLPHVDIFLPSLEELLYMLDRDSYHQLLTDDSILDGTLLEGIAERVLDYGAGIVVIKLGSHGLFMCTPQLDHSRYEKLGRLVELENWSLRRLFAPRFEVNMVGTTGAGDSAIAGFLTRLTDGAKPEQVLNFASAVGACNVEAVDASGGIRPAKEVLERIAAGWERGEVEIELPGWSYDPEYDIYRGEDG